MVQVIILSPENGASDTLADITIMFYVHIYPYNTIHMSHEGTALAKFCLLARISGSQYMAKQCRATCLCHVLAALDFKYSKLANGLWCSV